MRKFSPKAIATTVVLALGVSVVATACSSGGSAPDQQCFQPLSQTQVRQITNEYGSNNTYTNATGQVCVLVPNGNGGYTEQYYANRQDSNLLWMYLLMGNHANNFAANYGMVTGQISPFDYLVLSQLRSVNSGGQVIQPYSHSRSGWAQNNTVVSKTKVTYRQYGRSRPISFGSSTAPPKGYTTGRTMPTTRGTQLGTVGKNGSIKRSSISGSTAKKYGWSGYKSGYSGSSGSKSGYSGYKSGYSGGSRSGGFGGGSRSGGFGGGRGR